ncbi:phage tail assembly chaperone [Piscinibacter sakaiensis]|uniref:Uncharacterized protein n=1 Tax=Piscinibacter sakaiensis TaxID=1547922 RepID=A0A0K8P821_PISS1|nr:phage tail assembly chaperone [Piscinibacter sakaiensis]GAP38786.1 hypothetical protein ISF6_5339 [Piscinibacter sakaiensis]
MAVSLAALVAALISLHLGLAYAAVYLASLIGLYFSLVYLITRPHPRTSNRSKASTMFKLSTSPRFRAPVVAHIPGDNGKATKVSFGVIFKRLTQDEYKALLARLDESKREALKNGDPFPKFGDREMLDEVLVGFDADLQEEDGTPMEFTPQNVDRLLSVYPIQPAIVTSFFDNFGKAAEKK